MGKNKPKEKITEDKAEDMWASSHVGCEDACGPWDCH